MNLWELLGLHKGIKGEHPGLNTGDSMRRVKETRRHVDMCFLSFRHVLLHAGLRLHQQECGLLNLWNGKLNKHSFPYNLGNMVLCF